MSAYVITKKSQKRNTRKTIRNISDKVVKYKTRILPVKTAIQAQIVLRCCCETNLLLDKLIYITSFKGLSRVCIIGSIYFIEIIDNF